MGVDYSGHYGIGVKLGNVDFEDEDDCMSEYIYDLPEPDGIELTSFETGSENYGGDENSWHLCIEDPFSNGVSGLIEKIEVFKEYLKANKIQYTGDVDCVGGLNMW